MVSDDGVERDRRCRSPYWGLVETLGAMLFVGVLALGYCSVERIQSEQARGQQATEKCGGDPARKNCGDVIAIRAVVASEQAIRVAIWQTAFSFLGLVGLAGTVAFAGMAWAAARDSADADNAALRLTRDGLKEARQDAAEQVARFEQQIHIARAAADASRDLVEAQRETLRPWVGLMKVDVAKHVKPMSGTFEGVTLRPWLKNTGSTPAIDLQMHTDVVVNIFPLVERDPILPPIRWKVGGNALFPRSRVSAMPAKISADDLNKLKRKEISMFLCIRLRYGATGMRGKVMETEHCAEIRWMESGTDVPDIRLDPIGSMNRAT